jgi:hypothetical protein
MAVKAITSAAAMLPLGDRWVLEVRTTDDGGRLVSGDPAVVVTLPDGSTLSPALEFTGVGRGRYRTAYTTAATGRHVAVVTAAEFGVETFAVYVAGQTTASGMPNTDDVADYLREGAASWETEDLADALDAEAAAQRSVCRVGAVYPADLRQALLRRVQRNLAMRQLPLAVLQGDADSGGADYLPRLDPEVRRLEAPHRRLVVG